MTSVRPSSHCTLPQHTKNQTKQEHFGAANLKGKSVAWVGDGNNVLHDLALAAARLGEL